MINGYIFYFLGQLFGGQLFELFARETNLKKQSSVLGVDSLLGDCGRLGVIMIDLCYFALFEDFSL